MKKINYMLLIILGTFILTGCNSKMTATEWKEYLEKDSHIKSVVVEENSIKVSEYDNIDKDIVVYLTFDDVYSEVRTKDLLKEYIDKVDHKNAVINFTISYGDESTYQVFYYDNEFSDEESSTSE